MQHHTNLALHTNDLRQKLFRNCRKRVKQWHAAGADISSLWHDERLDNAQKKRIARALIDKVVLLHPEAGKLEIRIVWKRNAHDEANRPSRGITFLTRQR